VKIAHLILEWPKTHNWKIRWVKTAFKLKYFTTKTVTTYTFRNIHLRWMVCGSGQKVHCWVFYKLERCFYI